jgi:hypothetical protein
VAFILNKELERKLFYFRELFVKVGRCFQINISLSFILDDDDDDNDDSETTR